MARQNINIGTSANSRNGDSIRNAFSKVNDNFTELYATLAASSLTELAQDYAAAMLTNGTHSGVNVVYNDSANTLNISVTIDGGTATTTF